MLRFRTAIPLGRCFGAALLAALLLAANGCEWIGPERPEFEARVTGAVEMEITGAGGFMVQGGVDSGLDRWTVYGSTDSWHALGPPRISIYQEDGEHGGRLRLLPRDEHDQQQEPVAGLTLAYRSSEGHLERFEADSGYVEITAFNENYVKGHFRAWATHVETVEALQPGYAAHGPDPDGDEVYISGRFDVPPVRTVSAAPGPPR